MKQGRNNQKAIWVDKDFAKEMDILKAELLLAGKPVKNIGQLTKRITQTKSFKQIRQELLKKISKTGIRIDN